MPVNVRPGKRLHGEGHRLALLDLVDVALADLSEDLHVREIVRDQEELRCREAGRDRLSVVDVALDDDTVDGRVDGGVREVLLRPLEGDAGGSLAGLCDLQRRAALLERAGRDQPLRGELEGTSLIARRLVRLRLQLLEVGLRVGHPLLRDGRVDAREELALLDVVVEVDEAARRPVLRPACRR